MPRDGSNIYSPPAGTLATPNTEIESARYNTFIADLVVDANAPRPIVAGGTGASTVAAARAALGIAIGTDVQAYDADLAALAANSTNGLLARTGTGTAAARTITAGDGISVTNGDGVSGNPTIAASGIGTAQISDGAVTLAKMQDLAASRLLGRGSAGGTGDPQELTPTGSARISGTNLETAPVVLPPWSWSVNVTEVQFLNLSGWDTIEVDGFITATTLPIIQVSPDNGVTWRTANYNYETMDGVSTSNFANGFAMGRTAGAGNHHFYGRISGMSSSSFTQCFSQSQGASRGASGSGSYTVGEIHNAIRVIANTGVNITGGALRVTGLIRA